MSTPTGEIYDLKESPPAPPARAMPVQSQAPSPPGWNAQSLKATANVLTWTMVAVFLIGGAFWAAQTGMRQRLEIWQATRPLRFEGDILRGFQFGNDVLRYSEKLAHLQMKADAIAGQDPKVLDKAGLSDVARQNAPDIRRLTTIELVRGLVGYMDDIVQNRSQEDYDLDYPPLRLAVMTLWVRHVQRSRPDMDEYPTQHVMETDSPRDEDIAQPLLEFNAWCAGASAVAMFLLVWVWVNRSFKPARPGRLSRWWKKTAGDVSKTSELAPSAPSLGRWTVPHGIFVFMLATGGFWYAYSKLVNFPARPGPAVGVVEIRPDSTGANLIVSVNAQNQENTRWHVDYGPTAVYGQRTDVQTADASMDDQQMSVRLQPLMSGQTEHFRVCAENSLGSIASDDYSFLSGGPVVEINGPMSGGIDWPNWTVWLRLLGLFVVMVLSAQRLPPAHRGWACGAVAAMLIWFDPMVLMVAHAWPQWDVWIVPFFLFAALFASVNWWLLAGALLGVGCMFKGQLLLAGPILILWPLFEGRWGALARILVGFVVGAEIVTWPWLINSPSAEWYVLCVLIGVGIMSGAWFIRPLLTREFRRWVLDPLSGKSLPVRGAVRANSEREIAMSLLIAAAMLAAMTIVMVLVLHGVAGRTSNLPGGALGFYLILVLIVPWALRGRAMKFWAVAVLAMAVWIAAEQFGGSYSWATLGFAYGSVRHDQMQMSLESYSNLSSLLSHTYGWDIHDLMGTLHFNFTTPGPWRIGHWAIPSVTWNWSTDLDVKQAMSVLYGICLVISAAAAALHSRRKDRRFLVTLCIPWLVFPIVMCQMGDRYPIWASTISAAVVAVSLELSLLHVAFAAICFGMITRQLLTSDPNRWPQIWNVMQPTFPGIAWMLLLMTAIFFVAALRPTARTE